VATGTVHVVWPEVTDVRSTVAVLLEVDPVALVRGRSGRGDSGFSLSQYVNDRPYAASSMLSVALGKVFRTAMAGRCDARPEARLALRHDHPGDARPPGLGGRPGRLSGRRGRGPHGRGRRPERPPAPLRCDRPTSALADILVSSPSRVMLP
jgi:hypothetical protein